MTKLEKALQSLPKFERPIWDKRRINIIAWEKVAPLFHIRQEGNQIGYITNEDGELTDGAFTFDGYNELNEELYTWAEKHGYCFDCLYTGTFGLFT